MEVEVLYWKGCGSMFVQSGVTTWSALGNADNALVTVTQAADARGRSHRVTTILASYSGVSTGLLRVLQAAVPIAEYVIVNNAVINFSEPLMVGASSALSVTLAASGTAGIIGRVTVVGYTE